MQKLQNIKRVAVIGGGPAGVAMAKYLVAEKVFTTIDVYEQRSTCAGVWNYTPENDHEAQYAVPQTKPYRSQEQTIWRKSNERNPRIDPTQEHATFISPLYERLEANLVKMLMKYSDLKFPDESQLFPTHEGITEYLERYADDVRHLIQFETQLVEVKALGSGYGSGWQVTTENLKSKATQTSDYDAVAIATGHYTVPFIPDIPGLHEWNTFYPGSVTHSKFYRRPEDFKELKTLTIGVGYSGLDIANQVESFCARPILVSSRAPTTIPSPHPETRINVGQIKKFEASTRSIHFKSPPGFVARDIDCIIFCTGYLYSYPGFDQSLPPFSSSPLLSSIDPGARTHNVYEHVFYNAAPSLACLALPQKVVPFPISESQAAVIAGVWSGRLELPSFDEMLQWEEDRIQERGNGKTFHYMAELEDVRYINKFYDWATGHNAFGPNGHINGHNNMKEPPFWGDKDIWMRSRVGEMKNAFNALGEKRHNVRTMEELGFHYEQWKTDQEHSGLVGEEQSSNGTI